jgi:LCP family protein required for cell wall assembly
VRTTLKRGIGRGAALNGDGRAVLPPGALTPVTRYRQPPPPRNRVLVVGKILLGIVATVVLFAGGIAGGAYLFFHKSVGELGPKSAADRLAASFCKGKSAGTACLNPVTPHHPAIGLIIGYDHRFSEGGPGRSDTVMLIRTQPSPAAISLLSFPRDLLVDIKCKGRDYGVDKINVAYAICKSSGTLATVRSLTGLPINYLITVNFTGFQQIVDKLGGVWIDVDRRYYHSNAGIPEGSPEHYAEINLRPGYQKVNGWRALNFVRYRHTDNDLYRNARQQEFLKAVKQQVSASVSPSNPGSWVPLVSAITHNIGVGVAGGGAPSEKTVVDYAFFFMNLKPGHIFQVKIPNLDVGVSDVTASTESIQAAVRDFQNPDLGAAEKAGSIVLHRKIGSRTKAPLPQQTSVTVLNGNGVPGSATLAADALHSHGYRIVYPPNGIPADAPQRKFRTQVYFDPAKRRSKAAARKVANLFGAADVLKLPRLVKRLSNGSMVVVVVGQTFHGSIAPAPVDHTPPKQPPAVSTTGRSLRGALLKRRRKVDFPLEVPRLIERSSRLATDTPIRTYRINGDDQALRMTFQMPNGLEYWGIEETNWQDAPVLGDRSFDHKIRGRDYSFYWNGPNLHMVVLHEDGATYWVINTLLDTLSPQTMVAIAKSLTPLPEPKKR